MAELVDAPVSGTGGETPGGSRPLRGPSFISCFRHVLYSLTQGITGPAVSKLYDQLKKAALQHEESVSTENGAAQPQPGGLLARALQRAESERNRAQNQRQMKQTAADERDDREAARALDARVEGERHATHAAHARADADRKNTD